MLDADVRARALRLCDAQFAGDPEPGVTVLGGWETVVWEGGSASMLRPVTREMTGDEAAEVLDAYGEAIVSAVIEDNQYCYFGFTIA